MSAFPQRFGPQVPAGPTEVASTPAATLRDPMVTLVTACPSLQAAATSSSVGGSLLAMIPGPDRPNLQVPPGCLQVLFVKLPSLQILQNLSITSGLFANKTLSTVHSLIVHNGNRV